jgi:hypothetical protein
MSEETDERRFHGEPGRLRSKERLALLEVDRVVSLSIEGLESGRILDAGTGTGIFRRLSSRRALKLWGSMPMLPC